MSDRAAGKWGGTSDWRQEYTATQHAMHPDRMVSAMGGTMETNAASPAPSSGLVERVKGILLQPSKEWDRIDTEYTSTARLYKNYVMPLAAIPVLAGLIGSLVFGHSLFGISYRPSFGTAVGAAVVQYVLTLASVFVIALIIDGLAPVFHASRNRAQALKVAAYSATAAWVAGIFEIIPAISLLSILGFYSLYLLYLGLPKLMKAPQDKALSYTAVVIVASIAVWILIGALASSVTGLVGGGGGVLSSSSDEISGSMNVPDVGAVDLDKLNAAARQMEDAARDMENGAGKQPIDPGKLAAFLPSRLAGLERTGVESSAGGVGGIGGSQASATYGSGEVTASLEVTDLAAMGGFAAMGSALNIQSSHETDTGYERVSTADGRMVTEKWDKASRSGSYNVIVGNRFVVEAEGQGIDMDDLKAAVASVNLRDLEKLAGR